MQCVRTCRNPVPPHKRLFVVLAYSNMMPGVHVVYSRAQSGMQWPLNLQNHEQWTYGNVHPESSKMLAVLINASDLRGPKWSCDELDEEQRHGPTNNHALRSQLPSTMKLPDVIHFDLWH